MAVVAVDGTRVCPIHRSVLERVAEIGARLGCGAAPGLGALPVSLAQARLRRLRRDLAEVIAFADASRRTGWVLGELAAAPGMDDPVPLLDLPQGRLWAHWARGFEMHDQGGVKPITALPAWPGPARPVALGVLIAPLYEAAAHARVLEIYQRDAQRPSRHALP